jgi:hypothetical protein
MKKAGKILLIVLVAIACFSRSPSASLSAGGRLSVPAREPQPTGSSSALRFGEFANLNDDDLKAIFAYLRTLPPVKHRVDNSLPPTYCSDAAGSTEQGIRIRVWGARVTAVHTLHGCQARERDARRYPRPNQAARI